MSAAAMAALTAALQRDPALARDLTRLQETACAALDTLIQDTAAWLGKQTPAAAAAASSGPIDVVALGALARGRAGAVRQARELAEAFVMGALINQGNANWNPLDPATSRSGADSLLVTLLLAACPGALDTPVNQDEAWRNA